MDTEKLRASMLEEMKPYFEMIDALPQGSRAKFMSPSMIQRVYRMRKNPEKRGINACYNMLRDLKKLKEQIEKYQNENYASKETKKT